MHWQILLWPFRTTPLILLATYTAVAAMFRRARVCIELLGDGTTGL